MADGVVMGRISDEWKMHGIPLASFTVRCHCGNDVGSVDPIWQGARCAACGVVYHVAPKELLPCGCERPWDWLTSACYTWIEAHPAEAKTERVPHHCYPCKGLGEMRQMFNMPTKDDPLGQSEPPRIECTPCSECSGTGIVLGDEPGDW